jgi:uncharacterized protein YraI
MMKKRMLAVLIASSIVAFPAFAHLGPGFTTAGVNLRADASEDASRIGGLAKGARVEVLKLERGWYQVRTRTATRQTGWVRGDFIRLGKPGAKHRQAKPQTAANPSIAPVPSHAATPQMSSPSLGEPTDDAYRGVLLCSWLNRSNAAVRELLDQGAVFAPFATFCEDTVPYLHVQFGSEASLERIKDVVRTLANVPDAFISSHAHPQYPAAILVGTSHTQGWARIADVASAIENLRGNDSANALDGLRKVVREAAQAQAQRR